MKNFNLTPIEEVLKAHHLMFDDLTPMMKQYYNLKKNYNDAILFFRMGDFYEVFFSDAKISSDVLGITLTHRGKIKDCPIPMAGIPYHAANQYVSRLADAGLKIAICEQIQDPKEAQGIVQRGVTQVVTPSLPYEVDKSDKRVQNYLLALGKNQNDGHSAILVEFSTGEFYGLDFKSDAELVLTLDKFKPRELITYPGQLDDWETLNEYIRINNTLITILPETVFSNENTENEIEKIIPYYKSDNYLKEQFLSPLSATSFYLAKTQGLKNLNHLKKFHQINADDKMEVSASTLEGLEILPRTRESLNDSLLGFMDHTQSSMGHRRLKKEFLAPSLDKNLLTNRFDMIEELLDFSTLNCIREQLQNIVDIERIHTKLHLKKIRSADLISLRNSITAYQHILNHSKNCPKLKKSSTMAPELLKKLEEIQSHITETFNEEIGASLDHGNLIKEGFNSERDSLYTKAFKATELIQNLESKYREELNIGNLKIKKNNINGYFIEVSKSHLDKVPDTFIRKQTLTNSERYVNEELKKLEIDAIMAKERLYKVEKDIFDCFIDELIEESLLIQEFTEKISFVDFMQSLAFVSINNEFTRPEIRPLGSKVCSLKQVWHPLIKRTLHEKFVPHNITLDDQTFFALITGPNMAGKTTLMREVAIVQFLAQVGSYVPAEYAKISLCDFLLSRLGAHDNILKGQSTFMVEMVETAEILRYATENSLVIFDEVGRGTSTFDGLSIAWAISEHLHNEIKCRVLFSTHYHELIELIDRLKNAKNLTIKIKEIDGKVHFLYEVIEEGAKQSFGVKVAELAGLPVSILNRANNLLEELESKDGRKKPSFKTKQDTQLTSQNEQLDFLSQV